MKMNSQLLNESIDHESDAESLALPAYPTNMLRPADAPVPGRPRRRGQGAASMSSTAVKLKKKKKRKKRKHSISFLNLKNIASNCIKSLSNLVISEDSFLKTIPRQTIEITVCVCLWYTLGVVSITTSRILLTPGEEGLERKISVKPTWLTFQQFCIGSILLHSIQSQSHSSPLQIVTSHIPTSNTTPHQSNLFYTALFFCLGFWTTNISFFGAVPSLVETIKAAEPITSAILVTLWNIERLSQPEVISLCTIVLGVLLSTLSNSSKSTAITMPCLFVVLCSNLCFSLRGLYQKLFREASSATHFSHVNDVTDVVLQYRMQILGATLLAVPAILLDLRFLIKEIYHSSFEKILVFIGISFSNGIAFVSYNLASTYILTRISVVHHATLNCLRRVFAIIATSIFFGVYMSWLSCFGILVSIFGFMCFTHYKLERRRQPKPLSSLLPMSNI